MVTKFKLNLFSPLIFLLVLFGLSSLSLCSIFELESTNHIQNLQHESRNPSKICESCQQLILRKYEKLSSLLELCQDEDLQEIRAKCLHFVIFLLHQNELHQSIHQICSKLLNFPCYKDAFNYKSLSLENQDEMENVFEEPQFQPRDRRKGGGRSSGRSSKSWSRPRPRISHGSRGSHGNSYADYDETTKFYQILVMISIFLIGLCMLVYIYFRVNQDLDPIRLSWNDLLHLGKVLIFIVIRVSFIYFVFY